MGKYILKKLLSRYVPRELFERPKMGFAIPLDRWLKKELKAPLLDYLSPARLSREGLFNTQMVEKTESMLKSSLDALVNLDTDLAVKVCILDDDVDEINGEVHRLVKSAIQNNPEQGEHLINLLLISRHLERIADHATNIAEEVIYLIEGEIVRHGEF